MNSAKFSPRAVGLWMAVITAVSWALLAIALKMALHTFTSGTIVYLRLILAFAVLIVLFTLKRREWLVILRRPPLLGILAGALIAFNYYGFMKGVELTTASNAQIMIQLAPLSFAVLSILLFREIPTWLQGLGMMLALTGFGFFYWDQILLSWDDMARFQEGNLWIVMAAATWAAFALLQKVLLKAYQPQQFNLLIYGISAFLLLPTAHFSELRALQWFDAGLIIFLALNTVIAYGALSESLIRIPASQVSVIIAVNPLLTIAIMTCLTQMEVGWIKGEPIGWRGVAGAFMVVIGVISTVTAPARLSSVETSPKL